MDGPQWSVRSAGLGAVLWLAAPWLPVGSSPSFGSLEHVFVFLPLVAAPLALLLLSTFLQPGLYGVAQRMQPMAASMVLASLFVAKGALAGALTVGWLIMAVMVAISGVRGVRRGASANLSLLAAHLFLPVGGVWLLLSRLGVGPRSFSALTVFLAAVHLHFSGFTLQILIAAARRQLEDSASRLRAAHRCVAIGAIAGIPLIAAGNAFPSPVLKLVGVASMVLSVIGLAAMSLAIAPASPSRIAKWLLVVSAVSGAAAMIVAGVYGAGELAGRGWIGIPRMVQMHGLLNAVGFTFCGLTAHLQWRSASELSRREGRAFPRATSSA
ncbi:MAG: rane protein [Myxococcaceae bacterium]|nr:rane protein [Myxococcaceae bacterium]